MAIDDKCEQCYKTWRQGFGWMGWQQLTQEFHSSGSTLRPYIEMVMKKVEQNLSAEQGPGVVAGQLVEVEVSRLFQVANEQEIKSKTKQNRLPKSLLRSLPSLELPCENGDGKETCYVFKHPRAELRECRMTVKLQCAMENEELAKNGVLYPEQAEHHFAHAVGQHVSQMGMGSVLGKESSLTTFAEWSMAKFEMKKPAEPATLGEEHAGNVTEAEDDDDDDSGAEQLQGIAAVAPKVVVGLQRGSSTRSLSSKGGSASAWGADKVSPTCSEKKGGAKSTAGAGDDKDAKQMLAPGVLKITGGATL